MAIVEDEKRDVLMAQLYHQEDDTDCPVEDVLVEEETHTLRLNRSLAFLKTCQFDAALSDAETTIVATTHNTKPAEKGLFRKAEALYSLGRYRECCEVLKQLRLEYPNNGTAKTQLTRAIRRLAEQTNGKYVFKQLYAEANRLRPPLLDYATYVGAVAIRASGTRGRGLFTTKPVKAGDLLFCEKAFTHAFLDKEEGRGSSLTMLIDMENGGTMGSQSDLINMTVRKLFQNPSLMTIITDLHHGSYQPVNTTEVNGTPVIDTCVSNARRAFIGDFMIARATRDLSANTEITWWYQPPGANNYAKQKEKLGHWGFEVIVVKKEVVVGRMEAAVKAMGETYGRPASEVPRLAVWEALQKPLMKLVQTKQLRAGQMVKLILMAFEALGFVIEGGASGTVVVRQWGLLMDAVVDLAPELVKTAEGYARTAYRMVFGEDETFEAFGDT
ncbi:hypothetical protein N0V88_007581 [Collariella sp. IMI 366227]|nr:hypothetical protein N0V88_007581 [Collariella sp. IMI 366227]